MTFEELRNSIAQVVESAGDRQLGDPMAHQIYQLSHEWGRIAGPYYVQEIRLDGWKNDWVRGAKLAFLESCVALAYPDSLLDKSTDLPREVYDLILEFITQHPDSVKGWIVLHEQEILQRANLLMIAGFKEWVNRTPILAAEHLPNIQGETPIRHVPSGQEAMDEIYDL